MRTARLAASGVVAATALAAGLFGFAAPATAAVPASVKATDAKTLAVEVCEDMVRDVVIGSTGGPLAGPQSGTWNANGTRYTCTYPLNGGQLVIRVDTYPNQKKARSAYAKTTKKSKVDQKLNGIGERAFLARDGHVVAEKDRFVLTADPSRLPAKLSKANVSLAAVESVLSCWVGTGGS